MNKLVNICFIYYKVLFLCMPLLRLTPFQRLSLTEQKQLLTLVKTPYQQNADGDFHSGIKINPNVQLVLKTLPTHQTPTEYLNKAHQQSQPPTQAVRKLLTPASLQSAQGNLYWSKKLGMIVPHLGFFRTHKKHPWVKKGYLRPGVHVVMEQAKGQPGGILYNYYKSNNQQEQAEALLSHLNQWYTRIKNFVGHQQTDTNINNYFVDVNTDKLTEVIDPVRYSVQLSKLPLSSLNH
jgi:hypothetical protein